jgi:crossover junction endodeoxyribonuclease RuvC
MNPPRVYGIDTSLTATGIASSLGWCDTIGASGITNLPLHDRDRTLCELADRITHTISLAADLVVIEAPAYSRSGGGAHERAALWWRVVHRLHNRDIPVVEVLPTVRALYATGRANSGKTQVVEAVTRRWPAWQTLGDDNAADAVTLMALGLDHLGAALCDMPAKNRTALNRVTWPQAVAA